LPAAFDSPEVISMSVILAPRFGVATFFRGLVLAAALLALVAAMVAALWPSELDCRGGFSAGFSRGFDRHRCDLVVRIEGFDREMIRVSLFR
jgi:hypothetical protein